MSIILRFKKNALDVVPSLSIILRFKKNALDVVLDFCHLSCAQGPIYWSISRVLRFDFYNKTACWCHWEDMHYILINCNASLAEFPNSFVLKVGILFLTWIWSLPKSGISLRVKNVTANFPFIIFCCSDHIKQARQQETYY